MKNAPHLKNFLRRVLTVAAQWFLFRLVRRATWSRSPVDDISRTGAKPSGEALKRFRIVAGGSGNRSGRGLVSLRRRFLTIESKEGKRRRRSPGGSRFHAQPGRDLKRLWRYCVSAITMALSAKQFAIKVKCEGARYADPWRNLQAKTRIKSFNMRV